MSTTKNYDIWTSISTSTNNSPYISYDKVVSDAKLTKTRDKIRKKKKKYIFNPNDLDLEGEK